MGIFKGILFILVLIYAGIYDYKNRIIPDKVHVLILLATLLSGFDPIKSILGLIILPIPFIIPIFFNENSIGGGDIKLVGAIGFYLGLREGTIAIIIGLLLSTIISIILRKDKIDLIPLGPYLATGSILAFLL